MVLVAVGGVWLLLSPGGDDSGTDTAATTAPSAEATTSDSAPPASDTASSPVSGSPAEPSPSETAPVGDPVDVAGQAAASAPRTAPPNEDVYGNRTTYAAGNMLDGSPSTCWRMPGDGTGSELTFALAGPTSMTQVGLINGYAKKVRVGGRTLNWYVGNRRVLSVQWVFDDGTTVDQALSETTDMQTLDLAAPVTTSTVRLRLVTVSAPGTGRSARDYTAISEVSLVGVPTA
jgi:hypothetical protein